MTPFERAVVSLVEFLESELLPYMVIGGVANLFWGVPRTTLDVDITVWADAHQISSLVERLGSRFKLLPEDPIEFIQQTRVLPLQTGGGIRVDLIFGLLPYEEEAIRRARRETFAGREIRICSPEDLILHKLPSDRSRDREDVRGVITRMRKNLDRAYLDPRVEGLAHDLSRPDILAFYRECLATTSRSGIPDGVA